MIYKCDSCDEEIEGDPVEVVRTSLPDPPFRPEKWPETYSYFDYCRHCADNLPGPAPYKIGYWSKDTLEFSHFVTGIETYSVVKDDTNEAD